MASSDGNFGRPTAPMSIRGNGTGPGTPFPTRRGPKRGARRPKGLPDHVRSIGVFVGGRFHSMYLREIKYIGGEVRYIHNVDPDSFSMEELFLCSQMMSVGELLPTRMWYHAHGASIPKGFYPLHDDISLKEMWNNCELHNQWMVRIYMHDLEYVQVDDIQTGKKKLNYLIPPEIPPVLGYSDAWTMHQDAQALHQVITEIGEETIGAQEVYGERWYIHTKLKPFVPLRRADGLGPPVPSKFMMELPNRSFGSINLWTVGGPQVYIDVYDEMIAEQLRIPDDA